MRAFSILSVTVLLAVGLNTSANAGILNYHKWGMLACIDPGYQPALDNRDYSVALADSIRNVAGNTLYLTHLEEHMSLAKVRSHESTARSLRMQAEIYMNNVMSDIVNVNSNLSKVKETEEVIIGDIRNNVFPESTQQLLSAPEIMTIEGGGGAFSEYEEAIARLTEAAIKAQEEFNKGHESSPVYSEEHRDLSDAIRNLTKETFSLLSTAESISAGTLAQGREQMDIAGIQSCGLETE